MEHDEHETTDGFAALGLREELLSSLASLGYEEPTPIQREAIPLLLAGHDLLGQAATGTGKTAAFALPVLQRLAEATADRSGPGALVLVPTRELAMQVSEATYKYGHRLRARVVPVYGGQHIGRQLDALRRGADVVVATPGRALDLLGRGSLALGHVQVVVLDEADEMLDMGFADELDALLAATPQHRQTVLLSATMPPRIEVIARRHLRQPVRIQIAAAAAEPGTAPLVRQRAYVVPRFHKAAALARILDVEAPAATIVFCRTRGEVEALTETLNGRGFRAEALHGGMDQDQRDRVMGRLRSGSAELLVATDVAARGLDVEQLTHVVNFDVPAAPESYVHRIGRVGRAGREGVAITLAEPREQRLLQNIERLTQQKIGIEKIPTVADLRAVRMEQTLATVREALESDDLEQFAGLLDVLSADHDVADVALAALKLAHEATGATLDEVEIPDLASQWERPRPAARPGRRQAHASSAPGSTRQRSDRTPTARIYIGAGRSEKVRPHDLVGAIANETRLTGRDIGAIKVGDHSSIVEIPQAALDEVLHALSRTAIRGKRVTVRRYRDERR